MTILRLEFSLVYSHLWQLKRSIGLRNGVFTLFLSPFEFSNVLYGCDDLDIGKARISKCVENTDDND